MDLRQIRAFVAVARERNFTRAAERLHVAQPAVSIAVGKLEADLDLILFNRQGKQVTLTAEGEAFLRHAERILDDCRAADTEMAEMKGLARGEVRIGIPPMMSSYYFPRVIREFRKRYPRLQISVLGEGAARIQRLIASGEIDMGVVAGARIPQGLQSRRFLREEIVACLPAGHRLAAGGPVRLEELLAEPLILFKKGYYMRELTDELMRDCSVAPQVVFETNLFSLVRSLIREGVGVSTLLRMVAADEPRIAAVSFAPPLFLDLHIAWKADSYLSRANRAFVDFLLEQAEGFGEG
ncbi:MAG: LysR family transcriptional regulator [Deltaproteobacteria bacterium]|nr:MAG: LysR family transcriptional regulator [Deltaproteobacteria bacterium]